MGCFTEISFTTLLPPTLSQGSVYPQPVLRAMSILRKVFEDLQMMAVNTANGCLLLGPSTD